MASHKKSGPIGFAGFVEGLRKAQEVGPVVQVFGYLGCILLGTGVVWGLWQFLNSNRYVLCIIPGLISLALSMLAQPGGILSMMPQGLQDFLLKSTWYDMLYEDSVMQNLTRKWGRMLMLCYISSPTAGDVRAVTDGLDPTFVDDVFRRTFIYYLSPSLQSILMPTPRRRCLWPQASPEARVQEAYVAGVGGQYGLPEDLGGAPITPQTVAKILKEKVAARNQAITEPDLGPAVTALGMSGLRPTVLSALSTGFKRATQLMGVGSIFCFSWAAVLRLPATQGFVAKVLNVGTGLRSLTSGGEPSSAVTKVGRIATGLGVLGLGGMIAFMSFSNKLGQAGADARVVELEARLARQAEEHEEALAKMTSAGTRKKKTEVESDDSTTDSLS